MRKTWPDAAGFQDGGRRLCTQNRMVSKKWKRLRHGVSLRASRRNAAYCYLDFSSEGAIFDFQPPEVSKIIQFSSVQSLSHVQLFATPWTAARQASLSITNAWSPPKPRSIESEMPSNHLILCHPLLLLPSIFPSIRVFSNDSAFCIRRPKYWSFSLSISPSNEHPGLVSFRMDWLDLLQESSPTPQFKSINSLALSFLHSPTLTSIHDHWKKHSLN